MRKLMIAILLMATPLYARADGLDDALKNRETMVASMATLALVPTKCTANKIITTDMVANFAAKYGHNPDNSLLEDATAKMVKTAILFDTLNPAQKTNIADVTCAWAAILSLKVRNAQ
jgi:hypothetical protein